MERMSTIDIAKEKVEFITLGELAEGMIEAKEDQQERLEEVTDRVGRGEFHVSTSERMPCGCIDGRCGCSLKPNTAGGTESLMVADDLINKQFATDGSTAGAYKNLVEFLVSIGEKIGGHDGPHADSEKTDCGANDKLDLIYAMIAKRSGEIRGIVESLGIDVDNDTNTLITQNATERTDFSKSTELLTCLTERAGIENIDHLSGDHKEVIAVINKRIGTTLDRDALEAEFGASYEAFNVDVWAFEHGANFISTSSDLIHETRQKVIAMAYYNIATALVLCGPKMRVVVLD